MVCVERSKIRKGAHISAQDSLINQKLPRYTYITYGNIHAKFEVCIFSHHFCIVGWRLIKHDSFFRKYVFLVYFPSSRSSCEPIFDNQLYTTEMFTTIYNHKKVSNFAFKHLSSIDLSCHYMIMSVYFPLPAPMRLTCIFFSEKLWKLNPAEI